MRRSLVMLPCLLACTPDERVFVGSIDGTDAEVGLVVQDGAATAYVCGGDETRTTLTRWFEGAGERDAGSLVQDDWTLAWSGAAGTLTDPAGTESAWAKEDQSRTAGVFDAEDSGCRDGAIVWDAGGSPVIRGTWGCYGGDNPMLEVTPVGTLRLADTIEATVAAPDGDHTFTLARVTLP